MIKIAIILGIALNDPDFLANWTFKYFVQNIDSSWIIGFEYRDWSLDQAT